MLSIVILCVGHYIRTLRWELFVSVYEKPDRNSLISSLSIGYIFNFFVPFKLGDIIRALCAGQKMVNGKGFSLATVIIDRCLDVIFVGGLFGIFYATGLEGGFESLRYYVLIAVSLVSLLLLAYVLKKYVKALILWVGRIFNTSIEEKLLKFGWSLIWGFKDMIWKISKLKLISYSILMWILYLISYYCFSQFMSGISASSISWTDVFFYLFERNSLFASGWHVSRYFIWNVIYLTSTPVIWLIVMLVANQIQKGKKGTLDTESEYTSERTNVEMVRSNSPRVNLLPYANREDRLRFLELYFSGEKREFVENYISVNRNILILRDYSSGSNATTILCTDGRHSFFRKYAFGEDAEKLSEQIDWLENHKGFGIPLPVILRSERSDEFCFYDMPYSGNTLRLFEYSHSNPKEKGWEFVKSSIEALESSLYTNLIQKASAETVHKYIAEKVIKNITIIENSPLIRKIRPYQEIVINGRRYKNLSFYGSYLNQEYLFDVFKSDCCSDIHGDLTVDNIVCIQDLKDEDEFYIIDPNGGNILETPNLDYAKLLQSVHGNYELFMSTQNVNLTENRIDFTFIQSETYIYMWQELDKYLSDRFSWERVRSIYWHEVVHWLRLMPYKLEKNGKRALLFYAGLLIILNDVVERYGEEQ